MDLIFKGVLHPDVLVTPNLYADNGNIASLTVSKLETSTKILNYLQSNKNTINLVINSLNIGNFHYFKVD